ATPTGLSTTTRSASLWMIRRPATGVGVTDGGVGGAGNATSSQAPPRTGSDFGRVVPSTVTSPASTRFAAVVRLSPNRRATAWSRRSPSRPSGTGRARLCRTATWLSIAAFDLLRRGDTSAAVAIVPVGVGSLTTGPIPGAVAAPTCQLQPHRQRHPDDQSRVGHVEDGEHPT